ncbi:1,6-anhydro-N-acetylmuramyl-L-alanine amidase AmpD [Castellaniella sp. GW247-6E4]|uniref:1,6-anhydro-N-acetylmuramyl-L-alanine amidase AmpD n=1 Tax=Castellaniella sp. GW247-6E4 TaxID=3140380 RepID=UPI00331630C7
MSLPGRHAGATGTRAGLNIEDSGWLAPAAGILRRPSPNHDARPGDEDPYLLVIHNISLPPGVFGGDAVIDFFQNRLDFTAHPWFENIRDLRVSAHFLIRRDGTIIQFVPTMLRAWHAGVSSFEGRERCNDFSVGIELEGTDTLAYTDAQYEQLDALAMAIRARHPIRAVQGHEHIAPGRKTDPGPSFDWDRFKRTTGQGPRPMASPGRNPQAKTGTPDQRRS